MLRTIGVHPEATGRATEATLQTPHVVYAVAAFRLDAPMCLGGQICMATPVVNMHRTVRVQGMVILPPTKATPQTPRAVHAVAVFQPPHRRLCAAKLQWPWQGAIFAASESAQRALCAHLRMPS